MTIAVDSVGHRILLLMFIACALAVVSIAARAFIDVVRSRPGRSILRAKGHPLEDVTVRR